MRDVLLEDDIAATKLHPDQLNAENDGRLPFLHLLPFLPIASSGPAQAADASSGNSMEPGCRLVALARPYAAGLVGLSP